MPEARDRLSRNEDPFTIYNLRRRNVQRGDTAISILADEQQATVTPFRWRDTEMIGTSGPIRGTIRTPESRCLPQLYRTPRPFVGRENLSSVVRSSQIGHSRSVLPSWYPRKPLRDTTGIVKAIERKRVRLRDSEGLLTPSPVLQDRIFHHDSTAPSTSGGYALQKHDISTISPHSSVRVWRCPPTIGKVPKILLDITNKADGDSDFLTPQKKLLNNIELVEKRVMEELHKVKRTPSAKKAEREKKVRTLMSMR